MTSTDGITEADRRLWRDSAGFSRNTETPPGSGTWHVMGPDDCSHAVYCDFIRRRGILPCSCDATRTEYPKPSGDDRQPPSWWYRCWFHWQEARVEPWETRGRVPWPVEGPDGEPWVALGRGGRDYTIPGTDPMPGIVNTEWGVRSPWGANPVADKAMARTVRDNMLKGGHEAAILWRGVTDWQVDDNG